MPQLVCDGRNEGDYLGHLNSAVNVGLALYIFMKSGSEFSIPVK